MVHGFRGIVPKTFIHERGLLPAWDSPYPSSPADIQFLAQVLDHLVARAGLPAAASADRGVFDLRSDLYGDKHRAGLAEDVGQSGREFLQFPEGESPGIAGAARDHLVVDVFGIGDRLAARRRIAAIVD